MFLNLAKSLIQILSLYSFFDFTAFLISFLDIFLEAADAYEVNSPPPPTDSSFIGDPSFESNFNIPLDLGYEALGVLEGRLNFGVGSSKSPV